MMLVTASSTARMTLFSSSRASRLARIRRETKSRTTMRCFVSLETTSLSFRLSPIPMPEPIPYPTGLQETQRHNGDVVRLGSISLVLVQRLDDQVEHLVRIPGRQVPDERIEPLVPELLVRRVHRFHRSVREGHDPVPMPQDDHLVLDGPLEHRALVEPEGDPVRIDELDLVRGGPPDDQRIIPRAGHPDFVGST